MTATMDLISEQVLSSAASSVTFSNIPQGFKDLVLEVNYGLVTIGNGLFVTVNGSSSNYSSTMLLGWGTSSIGSARKTNATRMTLELMAGNFNSSVENLAIVQIMSYTNTSIFKSALSRTNYPNNEITACAHLWLSTDAITSVTCTGSVNLQAGSVFRLWGVVG